MIKMKKMMAAVVLAVTRVKNRLGPVIDCGFEPVPGVPAAEPIVAKRGVYPRRVTRGGIVAARATARGVTHRVNPSEGRLRLQTA